MNWNQGFKRLSAAVFSLVGLAFLALVIALWNDHGQNYGYVFLAFPALYALHRLVCWIVDGFFSAR